jgi:cytoskeletal protein RodZ
MKRVGLIATIVIAAMLIAGCGNSNNIDNKTTVNESLAVSSSVGNTENNNSEIVKENQSSTEVTKTEPTTAETSSRKETTAIQKVIQNTTKPTTTSKQPTTQKASQCSNNNNHSMKCGNMGRWFDSKSDVKAYVDSVMKSWADKWESGEISDDEYFANCPQGYECWSCGYCGKWTGNFK